MVKIFGPNDISLFFSKYVIIDFHHFFLKTTHNGDNDKTKRNWDTTPLKLAQNGKKRFVLKLVILTTSLTSLMLLISPTLKHFLSLAILMVVKLLILTTFFGCEVAEFSNFSRLCLPFRH